MTGSLGKERDDLAEEQAALRRVATLVARGAPPDELFASVTEEAAQLLPVDFAGLGRCESDDTMVSLAARRANGDTDVAGARHVLYGLRSARRCRA
jgi:GAF domain-containing protein